MNVVLELNDLLQSHGNRDKVIGLTCYVLKLWGATSKRDGLMKASARMAAARATARLFDDAAALKTIMSASFIKKEGLLWGSLAATGTASQLLYLQAEKITWLLDAGVIALDKDLEYKCRTAHKLFWVAMSAVSFVRSIRSLNSTAKTAKSPKPHHQAAFTAATLTTTKCIFDVIHSVSWLPPGWLWGNQLSVAQQSSVATLSAVLALVIHYHAKTVK